MVMNRNIRGITLVGAVVSVFSQLSVLGSDVVKKATAVKAQMATEHQSYVAWDKNPQINEVFEADAYAKHSYTKLLEVSRRCQDVYNELIDSILQAYNEAAKRPQTIGGFNNESADEALLEIQGIDPQVQDLKTGVKQLVTLYKNVKEAENKQRQMLETLGVSTQDINSGSTAKYKLLQAEAYDELNRKASDGMNMLAELTKGMESLSSTVSEINLSAIKKDLATLNQNVVANKDKVNRAFAQINSYAQRMTSEVDALTLQIQQLRSGDISAIGEIVDNCPLKTWAAVANQDVKEISDFWYCFVRKNSSSSAQPTSPKPNDSTPETNPQKRGFQLSPDAFAQALSGSLGSTQGNAENGASGNVNTPAPEVIDFTQYLCYRVPGMYSKALVSKWFVK